MFFSFFKKMNLSECVNSFCSLFRVVFIVIACMLFVISVYKPDYTDSFDHHFICCTGKNAYAISVLRRVEMKLDGRDIVENRYLISLKVVIQLG